MNQYCTTLPTNFDDTIGLVLVTGAAGYIGGRLVTELLARGYRVRCVVIDAASVYRARWPGAEVVTADVRDTEAMKQALRDVDVAYYLIHSIMSPTLAGVEDNAIEAASFRQAAEARGINRIIYLGSLVDIRAPQGSAARGRACVAMELQAGSVAVTELRADIIIGAGSASFEIIRNLVRRLPLMLIPPWARYRHLAISIGDVIRYLVAAMEQQATSGDSFELSGEELTYEQMLRTTALLAVSHTRFYRFPYANSAYYSYAASLLTPVPDSLARALIANLRFEVVRHDRRILELIPFRPQTFAESLREALAREAEKIVPTRWSDAYPHEFEKSPKLADVIGQVTYSLSYSITTDEEAASLFRTLSKIGGNRGWLHDNWMWRLRGFFDRVIKGVGSERGRKRQDRLEVNEVIDFWRVEAIEPDRRLLLRAEMKLPGSGWLEFAIASDPAGGRRMTATVYFLSRGAVGRLYWYAFYPFHGLIFRRLLRSIASRSASA